MIGIDTNVLVRYLTQDDPKQAAVATRFLERLTPESPGYVPSVVVLELVWVLESCYETPRREIANAIETLLHANELVVESSDILWRVARDYRTTSADFADLWIARAAREAGCEQLVTFDRNAIKHAGMVGVE